MHNVLNESGINYVEVANEAAFYGPKIDVQVWRCWRTATVSAAKSLQTATNHRHAIRAGRREIRRARWWPSARTSA